MASQARRGILSADDIRRLVWFAVTLLIIVPGCAWLAGGFNNWAAANWKPGLNLTLFTSAPLATRIHLVAILLLVVTIWGMLALPKGDRRHKTLGWLWVSGMIVNGLASLGVPHGDSWIAAYFGGGSALALMAYGIYSAKRKRFHSHARTMSMLAIAMVLMTLLALLPGRLLHDMVFGG